MYYRYPEGFMLRVLERDYFNIERLAEAEKNDDEERRNKIYMEIDEEYAEVRKWIILI